MHLEIRDIWRPGAGLAGTRDSMAQIRDIPGNPGRVATLAVRRNYFNDIARELIGLVCINMLTTSASNFTLRLFLSFYFFSIARYRTFPYSLASRTIYGKLIVC